MKKGIALWAIALSLYCHVPAAASERENSCIGNSPLCFDCHASAVVFPQENVRTDTLWGTSLARIEDKGRRISLLLHLHGSLDAGFSGGDFSEIAFRMNQARIEAKGDITPRLSFQWRQRLNKSNAPAALDNLPMSIDCAWIRVALGEDKLLTLGKQGAAYGGFEYDLDPIEIYQYSDMCDYMSFDFMTGVTFAWQIAPSHQVQFQVLNSHCASLEDIYGSLPEDVRPGRLPLAYTLNWNGGFFDGRLLTRWSFTALTQAEELYNYFYALGGQLNLGGFDIYLDFYLSDEALDSRGILTSLIPLDGTLEAPCVRDVRYESWVSKLNYRVAPKWNVFAKGMYENAFVRKEHSDTPKGKYRTSYGYFGGVEYYPFTDNLRFYLAYLGRSYRFMEKARGLGNEDYSTAKFSLGFIYHIPLF